MAHSITAIILKDNFDEEKAKKFDLFPVSLGFGLTMFHIDHYYSACWQHKLNTSGALELSNIDSVIFPNEIAIFEILKKITNSEKPAYAIILTNYFGSAGDQYANVFTGSENIDKSICTINQALRHLGVRSEFGQDEFDTVGLCKIRKQPKYLNKYVKLADEYGV